MGDEAARRALAYERLLTAPTMLRQAVELDLRGHNLTLAKFEILGRLHRSDHGLRMAELADQLITSRGGMTYRVAQLERSGLVERTQVEGDDRGVRARITPAGAAVFQAALPGHIECVSELMPAAVVESIEKALAALAALEASARAQVLARGESPAIQRTGDWGPPSRE